ncbi:hypothetical protein AAY473_026008 [Plecturocebus cupreus]
MLSGVGHDTDEDADSKGHLGIATSALDLPALAPFQPYSSPKGNKSLRFKTFSCLSRTCHLPPRPATTPRHHARLIFIFLVETGFLHVGQAGLELLTSGDPPASASQSAGIKGVSHCTWFSDPLSTPYFRYPRTCNSLPNGSTSAARGLGFGSSPEGLTGISADLSVWLQAWSTCSAERFATSVPSGLLVLAMNFHVYALSSYYVLPGGIIDGGEIQDGRLATTQECSSQ